MTEKGEQRAYEQIADTLCSMHFTDGFCMPRHDPDCKCNKMAAACMASIKSRGVEMVWPNPSERSSGSGEAS